jgi:tetratricopeptide (TPR) repeat protein
VRTLDADEIEVDGERHRFIVMEHVEGRTLRALLEELGAVPEELCRHVGREVAQGLAAIHAAGAVHRDLKPENVLITREHVVKVMDLGVARLADEQVRLSGTGAFVGSVLYAAPEQFSSSAQVDGRADLHALGLVLYELATGRHPFEAEDVRSVVRNVLDATPRRCSELNPQLSPFFEELVHVLLAKDREQRFGDAGELARVLADGEDSDWWKARTKALRSQTRRPLRRIRIPRETGLHGRDAELSRLRMLYEQATAGDGQVVIVQGEAGIGKSRLVDELVLSLWASGEDIDFLYASYPPGGAATASGAFSTAYREHFGDDEAAIREALPQTPLLVPAFAALLRGDAPPAGTEPLTKDSLQAVFVHATRSIASRRPTVVLVDDLHFAPAEGRALFAALALAVAGHRILLVGTARPEVDEKWLAQLDHAGAQRMQIARLGGEHMVELLREALGSEHLARELAGRIAEKSDGNPFFVFEILRGLREGKFLTRRPDGTWITTGAIREIDVPSSVVELVQARVSDLGAEERNVLEVASCVGFEFDAALVGDVLGVARIPLLQRLGTIEKRHRLVRSVGRRFAFDHHQVQEVLYAGLSEPLREEYHVAIAEALELRHDALSKEVSELDGALCVALADHLLRGAQGARALRYLDAAHSELRRGYLDDAAARLAERALVVEGLVQGDDRIDLLLRQAINLDHIGRREVARAALDEALALADRGEDAARRARVRGALGIHCTYVMALQDATTHLTESRDMAHEAGDLGAEMRAVGNLGNVLMYSGRLGEALEQHSRSLELARQMGDPRGQANSLLNLGTDLWYLSRFDEALSHYQACLALARETRDRHVEALALGSLGNVHASLGRFAQASDHVEQQLTLGREMGDRRSEGLATGNLGTFAWSLGCLAEAQERFTRHLAIASEIGDRRSEALASMNLALLERSFGRPEEARTWLGKGLRISRDIPLRTCEADALRLLADLESDAGHFADAETLSTEALGIHRAVGQREGEAASLAALGGIRREMGRLDEARSDLTAALDIARAIPAPTVELVAAATMALLPDGDVAAALAALAASESRAVARSAIDVRLILWHATADPVHVQEAKRRLDHFVAHSPADCREPMIANVREFREIAAVAREQGIA